MSMSAEQCKKKLLELSKLPQNQRCADCYQPVASNPFVSLNLGLFICINCSGYHRAMGTKYSVTKSIMLDTFDEAKTKRMEDSGNERGSRFWKRRVPSCWPIITKDSHEDLLEQWIRAKYERKEFIDERRDEKHRPYVLGSRYGVLMKKRKQDSKWNQRFFVLSAKEGYLKIYIKQGDGDPKHKIHISNINIMLLNEEFTERKHSMLITFPHSSNGFSKPRHIFVYGKNSFQIIDWYLHIRGARLKFLAPYLYGVDLPVIDSLLSRNFIKYGYLYKTGGKNGDGWKKRFVCVDIHRFIYFEKSLDSEPIDEVSIEKSGMECFVMEGVDGTHPPAPTANENCFMVRTREKSNKKGRKPTFNFCAENRDDMNEWIIAFRNGMEQLQWLSPFKDEEKRYSLLSNISSRCSFIES